MQKHDSEPESHNFDDAKVDSDGLLLLKTLGKVAAFIGVPLMVIGGTIYLAHRARQLEIVREKRLAEEARVVEQQIAEQRRQAAIREAEEKRLAEAARLKSIADKEEADRLARQTAARKAAEEKKRHEAELVEKRRLEEARLAAEQRALEQRREHVATQLQRLQKAIVGQINYDTPDQPLIPYDPSGSGLSWRVHLLPALGLQDLYEKFHLNEPWDSEYNRALIAESPEVFGCDQDGATRFRSYLRLDGRDPLHIDDITDGPDQTALLFHVTVQNSVPWTRPDSFEELTVSPEVVQTADCGAAMFTLLSGSRHCQTQDITTPFLRAVCTPAGGEHLSRHWIFNTPQTGPQHPWSPGLLPSNNQPRRGNASVQTDAIRERMQLISMGITQYIDNLYDPNFASHFNRIKLSWRVRILPYMGYRDLYSQFRLRESWDHPDNLKLIPKMPDVFASGTTEGRTRFRVRFGNPDGARSGDMPTSLAGTDSRTSISLLYWTGPSAAVTWTQPESWPKRSEKRTLHSDLGWPRNTPLTAGLMDGSVVQLPRNLHPDKLAAITSVRGGEVFDVDECLENPEQPLKLVNVAANAVSAAERLLLAPDDRFREVTVEKQRPKESTEPRVSNARRIYGAIAEYSGRTDVLPFWSTKGDGSDSGLSWRVHILGDLGEPVLAGKFSLNEEWNGPQNQDLLKHMPEVFRTLPDGELQSTHTTLRLVELITNGESSYTLVDCRNEYATPWTQPGMLQVKDREELQDVVRTKVVDGRAMSPVRISDFKRIQAQNVIRNPRRMVRVALYDFSAQVAARGKIGGLLDGMRQKNGELSKVRRVDRRAATVKDHMKAIATANFEYREINTVYAPATEEDRHRRPIPEQRGLLSWRVKILPRLGYQRLYARFNHDEPWDSPHNLPLAKLVPIVFRDPENAAASGHTRIMTFSGVGATFVTPTHQALIARDITDGRSSTIYFFEAPPEFAVPWTKPADFPMTAVPELVEKNKSLGGIHAATFSGQIQRLSRNIDARTLRALASHQGGEIVGDFFEPL